MLPCMMAVFYLHDVMAFVLFCFVSVFMHSFVEAAALC